MAVRVKDICGGVLGTQAMFSTSLLVFPGCRTGCPSAYPRGVCSGSGLDPGPSLDEQVWGHLHRSSVTRVSGGP